jgi:hypothetical protein
MAVKFFVYANWLIYIMLLYIYIYIYIYKTVQSCFGRTTTETSRNLHFLNWTTNCSNSLRALELYYFKLNRTLAPKTMNWTALDSKLGAPWCTTCRCSTAARRAHGWTGKHMVGCKNTPLYACACVCHFVHHPTFLKAHDKSPHNTHLSLNFCKIWIWCF